MIELTLGLVRILAVALAVAASGGCGERQLSKRGSQCAEKGGLLVGTRQPYDVCIKRDAVIDLDK